MTHLIDKHLPVLLLALTRQQAQRIKVLLLNRTLGAALIVETHITRTRIHPIDIGNVAVLAETMAQLGRIWQITVGYDFDNYAYLSIY